MKALSVLCILLLATSCSVYEFLNSPHYAVSSPETIQSETGKVLDEMALVAVSQAVYGDNMKVKKDIFGDLIIEDR